MSQGIKIPWRIANMIGERLISEIKPFVNKAMVAGSIRRIRPLVGDLDVVVAHSGVAFEGIIFEDWLRQHFGSLKGNAVRASRSGEYEGVKVQILDVDKESWGSALLMATGSGDFNVMMRAKAKEKGLKLNQYGLFRGDRPVVKCDCEEVIFAALGMVPMVPCLREVVI